MTDPRVDAYLDAFPDEQRAQLQELRRRLAEIAPASTETISYAMPAVKLGRHFLVWYAGWRRHSSIYPMRDDVLARHAEALRGYTTTKGSLHFSPQQPLPDAVLEDLVRIRVAEIEAGGR